jgi:subtilisin-like proprotein convertase family protein
MTYRPRRGRNRLALLLATGLLSIGATVGTASAATTTFSNSATINIVDDAPAVPYPSAINASGLAGNVQKATVTLNGFTHTCPEDLAVLLVGPSGAKSVLAGNVGGCPQGASQPVINLTFDQAAPTSLADVPSSGYPASGSYRPSESGTTTLVPPAPGGPYPVNLDTFIGGPANGVWQLFIEDQAGVDTGSVNGGWSLALTAPVNTVRAGKPKLNKKKGTARLPVTVGDAGQLTMRGKGVKSASASKSKAVAGPGTVKLTVKPKGKTRKKLNSTGKASVKVKLTFTPNGGTSSTITKKIKLKKTL